MDEMVPTAVAERRLDALLDAWASGIATSGPDEVAALFTDNALFQGFDPEPGRGREYITAYYAKQPPGLTAEHELLSVRPLSSSAAVGYARVLFGRPEGAVPVFLTVIAERVESEWLLSHYHVSKVLGG